jgi:dipeptidyl aminopeptidase/acylaminoacyl peptidase
LIAERAIDLLVARGIGDPTKVGIYGWSHGAFITQFLISHSDKFHVACLGEGGDFNPSGFWLGGLPFSINEYENVFGGPPWGETLKNYSNFSPFFHIEKIKAPVLMEFAKELSIFGMEMYVPLRYLKKPVELVVYDGEEHNFVKPKARIASMERKVDWFNYWLLGKKNHHPDKQAQYERWSQMR